MIRLPDYPELGPRNATRTPPVTDQQDRAALASARTRLLAADVRLRRELADDPDNASWGARYEAAMQATQTEAGAFIRSPQDRARFEQTAKLDLQRGATELARSARQLRFNEDLATLQETALAAGDEATRVAAIDTAGEIFAAALANDDLTSEIARQHRQDWVRNYAAKRIEVARLAQEGNSDAEAAPGEGNSDAESAQTGEQSPLAQPPFLKSYTPDGPGDGSPSTTSVEDDGTIVIEAVPPEEHGLGWEIADTLGLHSIFGDGDDAPDEPAPSAEDSERAASMPQRLLQAQIDHSNRTRFPEVFAPPTPEAAAARLGSILMMGEGNYESYNSGTDGPDGPVGYSSTNSPAGTVTGMTINQILETENLPFNDHNRRFATGQYQTIIPTLRAARDAMQLTGDELYTPEMQERVFREYLLGQAGGGDLADFVLRGRGTVDQAQAAAAQMWASIGLPAGQANNRGVVSDGFISQHERTGQNHANREATTELRNFLIELQNSRMRSGS